jgi:hypothetical protein
VGSEAEPDGLLSGRSFPPLKLGATHLPQLPFGAIRPFCPFLKPLGFRRHFLLTSSALAYGILGTFDLFDSSRAAPPENFLQLPLLSFASVWHAICPWRRVQSRD